MSLRVDMTPQGRWGLRQQMPASGAWVSVGPVGYTEADDALREAERLNQIQPRRWQVWDRQS